MGLEVSPSRPLAQLVVGAMIGRPQHRRARRGPYAPPQLLDAGAPDTELDPSCTEVCRRVLRVLLEGEPLGDLADHMAPDVSVWSPTIFAISRDEAVRSLQTEANGHTIAEVATTVTTAAVVPPRVYLEWRLTGRFTNPCFVVDDLLIEPTGQLVETSGVLVTTFVGGRIGAVHCYYDDLALLEQLLPLQ